MNMEKVHARIEILRQQMHKMAAEKGITHPEVLQISQILDVVLNEWYKVNWVRHCSQ